MILMQGRKWPLLGLIRLQFFFLLNIVPLIHFTLQNVQSVLFPEDIALSREIAEDFIKENFPTHRIKPVPGDGCSIIHAFLESLRSIDHTETFKNITSALRNELTNVRYKNSTTISNDTDLINQFEQYLNDPLSFINKVIFDLFLDALGMAYKSTL